MFQLSSFSVFSVSSVLSVIVFRSPAIRGDKTEESVGDKEDRRGQRGADHDAA